MKNINFDEALDTRVISNAVEHVRALTTAFDDLQTILMSLVPLLAQNLGVTLQESVADLGDAIESTTTQLKYEIQEVTKELQNGLQGATGELQSGLINAIDSFSEGLQSSTDGLLETIQLAIDEMGDDIGGSAGELDVVLQSAISEFGIELQGQLTALESEVITILDNVTSGGEQVSEVLGGIVSESEAFLELTEGVRAELEELISKLCDGLGETLAQLGEGLQTSMNGLREELQASISELKYAISESTEELGIELQGKVAELSTGLQGSTIELKYALDEEINKFSEKLIDSTEEIKGKLEAAIDDFRTNLDVVVSDLSVTIVAEFENIGSSSSLVTERISTISDVLTILGALAPDVLSILQDKLKIVGAAGMKALLPFLKFIVMATLFAAAGIAIGASIAGVIGWLSRRRRATEETTESVVDNLETEVAAVEESGDRIIASNDEQIASYGELGDTVAEKSELIEDSLYGVSEVNAETAQQIIEANNAQIDSHDTLGQTVSENADIITGSLEGVGEASDTVNKQISDNFGDISKASGDMADDLQASSQRGAGSIATEIASAGPEAVAATRGIVDDIETELERLSSVFETGGQEAAEAFSKKLESQSVTDSGSNMVDRISEAMAKNNSLKNESENLIQTALDTTNDKIDEGGFSKAGEQITQSLADGVGRSHSTLTNAIQDELRNAEPVSASATKGLVDTIETELERLDDVFRENVTTATDSMLAVMESPRVVNSGREMINKIAEGVANNRRLENEAVRQIQTVLTLINNEINNGGFMRAGEQITQAIADGVINGYGALSAAIQDIIRRALAEAESAASRTAPLSLLERSIEAIDALDIEALKMQFSPSVRLQVNLANNPFNFRIPEANGAGMPMFDLMSAPVQSGVVSYDQSDRSTFTQNVSYVGEQLSPAEQVRQTQYLIKRLKRYGL